MTAQPKTEQLADELENTPFQSTRYEAAAELRRLDAANTELLEALRQLLHDDSEQYAWEVWEKHGGAA